MRSLTARIVIAVLGTLLVSLVAFMATFLSMSGPANVRLIRQFQARQIEDGIATLQQQGPKAAAAFIARLDQSLGATHYLTDAAGRDLITGEDRSALLRVPRPGHGQQPHAVRRRHRKAAEVLWFSNRPDQDYHLAFDPDAIESRLEALGELRFADAGKAGHVHRDTGL